MSADVIDVTPEAEKKADKKGAIALHKQPSLSVWNRPVMSSDIEIAGTIQDGGIRPIGASHLEIVGTLLTTVRLWQATFAFLKWWTNAQSFVMRSK